MNKKNIILIVFLTILALGAGFFLSNDTATAPPQDLITSKDVGLTDKEKQVYLDEINKTIQKLDQEGGLSKDDKYKLNFHLGVQYYSLGEYQKALEYYKKAVDILPNNSTVWGELYLVANAMGDYKAADTNIKKAIELNPGSVQYWRWFVDLKQSHLKVGPDEMRAVFQEAIAKTSQSVDMVSMYAVYLESQGDLLGAVEQFKRAAEKEPAMKAEYEKEILRIQNLLK